MVEPRPDRVLRREVIVPGSPRVGCWVAAWIAIALLATAAVDFGARVPDLPQAPQLGGVR